MALDAIAYDRNGMGSEIWKRQGTAGSRVQLWAEDGVVGASWRMLC